jgi:hypothetical protein
MPKKARSGTAPLCHYNRGSGGEPSACAQRHHATILPNGGVWQWRSACRVNTVFPRTFGALLDLSGNVRSFIHFSDGKLHDVHALDLLSPSLAPFM